MRTLCAFMVLALLCLLFPINTEAQAPTPAPVAAAWNQPQPAPTPVPAPELQSMKFREGLSLRQRKEMGATFFNLMRITAKLQASGEITAEMTNAEASACVLNELLKDNPAAFQDPEIDWDALLAFIEKLMTMIMTWIQMFSQGTGVNTSSIAAILPEPIRLSGGAVVPFLLTA